MGSIRVALCQLNPTVGDLDGNTDRIIDCIARAEEAGVDLAVFPELAITGYPPEDLLHKPAFVTRNLECLKRIAAATGDCVALVGFVDREQGLSSRILFNAAAVCHQGALRGRYHKQRLPNYSVFDEQRYFAFGQPQTQLYEIGGVKVGVAICEDAWWDNGPVAAQAGGGAEVVALLNASPYFAGREISRLANLKDRSLESSVALIYVNQVGGQDELVFDGGSLCGDAAGEVVAQSPKFVEEMLLVDVPTPDRQLHPDWSLIPLSSPSQRTDRAQDPISHRDFGPTEPMAEIYNALVLGVADYVRKNGFDHVVLGLSGGVDSALVAAIAADALGSDRVHGLGMPSRYSTQGSIDDARALAINLGIDFQTVPINEAHQSLGAVLAPVFGATPRGLTDENLQSRIRGMVLMAVSNEYGWLVLTTGNKSEMAVGYSTLYGDTAGGFAVIKDVLKTTVYELCRWRNEQVGGVVIPEAILTKAPSAELRPDQRDDQSLPPYEVLDPIVTAYVEDDLTVGEIGALGHDIDLVARVVNLIDSAEYKRRQSPLGVRVTPKAFGKDRRIPITNRFRG